MCPTDSLSGTRCATVVDMTPSSPTGYAPDITNRPTLGATAPVPEAELGVTPTNMWFIALCHRCYPDFGQPFRTEDERDDWAAAHSATTGHSVHVRVDVDRREMGGHTSAVLRTERGLSSFVCTDRSCGRANGPFDSARLALASFRAHRQNAER